MIGLTTDWGLCKGAMPRVESDLRWHGSFCVGSVSCVLATILLPWFRSFPFGYFPLPKFYEFESEDAKERVLYNNFNRIDREVKEMIKEIQTEFKV